MLVVRNIGCLVTGNPWKSPQGDDPWKSPQGDDPKRGDALGLLTDAALIAADHLVSWYGPQAEMPAVPLGTQILDAHGNAVLPGLIDCHTHLVHVGDRSGEFALRARGQTYLEIAAAGGGIMATVRAVRAASEEHLVETALPRLRRALARGVTTIEIKSGYGLTVDDELKMLRAMRSLSARQPVEIVPTFLGAHTVPTEHRGRPDRYVELLVRDLLPQVAAQRLARFCDVYVEQSAFSVAQARTILTAAREHGLEPRLHTDQFNALGGCALAAELQAVSADHLEAARPRDIRALRRADVVAVIMPLCEVYLGRGRPAPGRALADAGLRVAVASDFNPGSANCEDLAVAATLAVSRCKLTVEEALLGITRHAATALGRDDLGRLHVGAQCDLVLLDTPSPVRVVSDMGANHVDRVVKAGRLVHSRDG
ncbi:MAG: imidazolonepropionase [Deltaproteobacteria bacterium]|nr:imidazolonepropionase [Deltaproteobacteria bacterium]